MMFPCIAHLRQSFHRELLFQSIGGEASRNAVESMADVLLALNKTNFDSLCGWMNNVVAQDGFPNQLVTRQQKETFARNVIK